MKKYMILFIVAALCSCSGGITGGGDDDTELKEYSYRVECYALHTSGKDDSLRVNFLFSNRNTHYLDNIKYDGWLKSGDSALVARCQVKTRDMVSVKDLRESKNFQFILNLTREDSTKSRVVLKQNVKNPMYEYFMP